MSRRRATPPYQPRFKEWRPQPHPRQREIDEHPRQKDIDAAQPPMKTLKGVGNGTERKHGYGRGGPC